MLCSFFLEKNMQSSFLRILSQHCGRYMVLQLLQTLSILFENIRNETSICEQYFIPIPNPSHSYSIPLK